MFTEISIVPPGAVLLPNGTTDGAPIPTPPVSTRAYAVLHVQLPAFASLQVLVKVAFGCRTVLSGIVTSFIKRAWSQPFAGAVGNWTPPAG